jgi:hypothetical protein
MRERLRPKTKETETTYGFYANVRDPRDVQLIRQASSLLGWPSNSSLLHLLADAYVKSNGQVRL